MASKVFKITNLRTPYKYVAIIKNGVDWRLFSDIKICCELMGLDEKIIQKHFDKVGYYTGHDFTIFRVQEENKNIHRLAYVG